MGAFLISQNRSGPPLIGSTRLMTGTQWSDMPETAYPLAELKLPPTLPADVFRPVHTKTTGIAGTDGRLKTADARESHSMY